MSIYISSRAAGSKKQLAAETAKYAEGKDSLRSLWGALGGKEKLAYPCHQALTTSPDDTSSGLLLCKAP